MEDILTSEVVVRSIKGGLRKFLKLAADPSELAGYLRRSISRRDYAVAVRSGEIPEWERAFAHVVVWQDMMRACAGRLPNGTLREASFDTEPVMAPIRAAGIIVTQIPPSGPTQADPNAGVDEREAFQLALEAEDLGYVHDPSWTNGGISSHGADLVVDKPGERSLLPALRGVPAYGKVVQVEGVPEIAWNHSASSFELGISSIQDAMVAKMLLGAAMGGASYDTPDGPTDDQIRAANLQRRIRVRLGRLNPRLQAVLELAYCDRRYENRLVVDYGVGLAPIVWRAAYRAGEINDRGAALPSYGTLRELGIDVRHEWPTYTPPSKGPLKRRIKKVAELLLWTAHEYYSVAADDPERDRKMRRSRARKAVAAARKAAKTRSLTPASRAA